MFLEKKDNLKHIIYNNWEINKNVVSYYKFIKYFPFLGLFYKNEILKKYPYRFKIYAEKYFNFKQTSISFLLYKVWKLKKAEDLFRNFEKFQRI